MTFFEGGIHSPFFVKWPAASARRARPSPPRSAHVDIFATAAAAAGAPLPGRPRHRRRQPAPVPARRSGRSSAPGALLALGTLQDGARRRLEAAGLRAAEEGLALPPRRRSRPSASTCRRANPDKVRELKALLAAHDAEMVPPAWPSLIEGPIAIDHPLGVPDSAGRRVRLLGQLRRRPNAGGERDERCQPGVSHFEQSRPSRRMPTTRSDRDGESAQVPRQGAVSGRPSRRHLRPRRVHALRRGDAADRRGGRRQVPLLRRRRGPGDRRGRGAVGCGRHRRSIRRAPRFIASPRRPKCRRSAFIARPDSPGNC